LAQQLPRIREELGMISGIYACSSSLETLQQQQEIIANNLANINTCGYKKGKGQFRKFDDALESQAAAGSSSANSDVPGLKNEIDFTAGKLMRTGNSLDLAIEGEGFFVLQSPNGLRFTRKGTFSLSSDGILVSGQGWPVVSSNGEIKVRKGTGQIAVSEGGNVSAGGRSLGKVLVVNFKDTEVLQRSEHTTFRTAEEDTMPPKAESAKVQQGYTETSNVEMVDELVAMIATMRSYEASQRLMSQQYETLSKRTSQASQSMT